MAKGVTRLIGLLFAVSQLAAQCPGTETGNPQYSKDDFGVSANYDDTWSFTEEDPTPPCQEVCNPDPAAEAEGIGTSEAPRTEFTDGTSVVTIFFVTLENEPSSLLSYLNSTFSSRTFQFFANEHMSGFKYDNAEAGDTGGDRQEYYFLEGTTLLYVVTDLFNENNGTQKFQTLIQSLRFD